MSRSKTRLWLSAILLASFYSIQRFTVRQIVSAALSLLSSIFAAKAPTVTPHVYFLRMRACLRCPAYDRARRTCGSPKSEHPEIGCWCYMPIKSGIKTSACWAREQGLDDIGWPSNIMPENL